MGRLYDGELQISPDKAFLASVLLIVRLAYCQWPCSAAMVLSFECSYKLFVLLVFVAGLVDGRMLGTRAEGSALLQPDWHVCREE